MLKQNKEYLDLLSKISILFQQNHYTLNATLSAYLKQLDENKRWCNAYFSVLNGWFDGIDDIDINGIDKDEKFFNLNIHYSIKNKLALNIMLALMSYYAYRQVKILTKSTIKSFNNLEEFKDYLINTNCVLIDTKDKDTLYALYEFLNKHHYFSNAKRIMNFHFDKVLFKHNAFVRLLYYKHQDFILSFNNATSSLNEHFILFLNWLLDLQELDESDYEEIRNYLSAIYCAKYDEETNNLICESEIDKDNYITLKHFVVELKDYLNDKNNAFSIINETNETK